MLYKLIVNAAFLAVGYYIGKQVGLGEKAGRQRAETPSRSKAGDSPGRPGSRPGT